MDSKTDNKIDKNTIEKDLSSLIYFGSPNKLVYFEKVNGFNFRFGSKDNFINIFNNESRAQTLKYRWAQYHLGKDYEHFILPCTPANEIFCKKHDAEFSVCTNKDENNLLDQCLIKVSDNSRDRIKGFQSGIRSAIVQWNDGKFYRLKGCGNNNDGFTIRKMGMPKDAIEVRGCAFKHTAIRELYMSEVIGEVLSKNGFDSTNHPIGFWMYDEIENPILGLKNEMKFIDKYCAVFEILGERRWGAHLLPGIESLIYEIANQNHNEINPNDFKKLFNKNRIINKKFESDTEYVDFEISPTMDCVPFAELEENQSLPEFIEQNNLYQDNSDLTDLFKLFLCDDQKVHETKLYDLFSNQDVIKGVLVSMYKKLGIGSFLPDYEGVVNIFLKELSNSKMNLLDLIGLLYARLGWEAGKVKRILQDNDINWGTYEDQPFRIHGNAHCDNYVIIPKRKSKFKNLLSPLDYDLAFLKENFINIRIDMDPEKYGLKDDHLFNLYLNIERQYLEWEITGQENLIVNDIYKDELKSNKKFEFCANNLLYLMRDSLDLHYRNGYLLKEFEYSESYHKNYDLLYHLIDTGLLISVDVIG